MPRGGASAVMGQPHTARGQLVAGRQTRPARARPALVHRLLRLPLFAKILIANSAIVALGATAGTYLTAEHVRASADHLHWEIMLLFGATGLLLSVAVNAVVLRAALQPLTRLDRTARRVIQGDLDARAALGPISDPATEELAASFNLMLDSLGRHARRLEDYSVRLRELSDQVLLAQEEERRRLARELHDETGQELSTLLLGLRLFRDAAGRPGVDPAALQDQAAELGEMARTILDGVRTLALDLRPRMLDDLGLGTALRAYIGEWSERTGLPVAYSAHLDGALPLPATTELAVYRLVQEALANIAKHASATDVRVSLEVRDSALEVEVRDNGRGMSVDRDRGASEPLGGLSAGLGLFGAQERIGLVGGQLTLESAPGQGTTVRAVIPLASRPAEA